MLECCGFCSHCGFILGDEEDIVPVCITDKDRPVDLNNTVCGYNNLKLVNKSPITNVLEVKGYYDSENNVISCSGLVMLREDLTFEGIVKSGITNEEKIVLGYLPHLLGMQLIALDSFNNPLTFNGVSNGREIYGYWSEFVEDESIDKGDCRIEFTELGFSLPTIYEIAQKVGDILLKMNNRNFTFYRSVIDSTDRMAGAFIESIEKNKDDIQKQKCIEIRTLVFNQA